MRIIDMHCDTMSCNIAKNDGKVGLAENQGQIDLIKLKKGGSLAQFFAIFIPTYEVAVEDGVTQSPYDFYKFVLQVYNREIKLNNSAIAPALNFNDIIKNKSEGKISSILTIEDGVPLDGDMNRLHEFYKDGVRLISLTWNYENSVAFPNSRDEQLMKKGLKPFGIDVVGEMNKLGMIVDVSHLSDRGFWDVIKHSDKPFVASHSCCRALCNHPRNLTDEMLKALGNKGGVVGINFCASFLNENENYTDINSIVKHLLHIKEKAGIDALGFGSDFDGIDSKLEFHDYSGMPMIVDALEKKFTCDEIDKICNGNMLRLIKDTL
ncbi:MAG: dipeptidase [Oscillospiraceae bacterium]